MFLSDISIKRPIMMSMILIVFVFFGALSYKNMNLEMTPETAMPIITVQTVFPGAGPQEVEVQVTKKIEDAISSVSQIDFVQSYSMENVSYILINFDLNKDVLKSPDKLRPGMVIKVPKTGSVKAKGNEYTK